MLSMLRALLAAPCRVGIELRMTLNQVKSKRRLVIRFGIPFAVKLCFMCKFGKRSVGLMMARR